MDNTTGQNDREQFEAVWQRVTGNTTDPSSALLNLSEPSAPPSSEGSVSTGTDANFSLEGEVPQLEQTIKDELRNLECYRSLTCRFQGQQATKIFSALCADAKKHLRKLQAIYFILTGDSFNGKVIGASKESLFAILHERYWGETEAAKALDLAAQKASFNNLSTLYASMAESKRNHVTLLETIIESLMQ